METRYFVYEQKSDCCGSVPVVKARVIIADLSQKSNPRVIRGCGAINENIISYKALAKRNGFTKNYNVKKVGAFGSNSPIGQVAQTIGTTVLPGNISAVTSPGRSAIARTLTPGLPGLPSIGSPAGLITRDRTQSRCPEGYQYGGRFTDNEFSTCGQQLFITAGPLGLAIGAIRKLGRLARTQLPGTDVNMLGGSGEVGSPIVSRRPDIPKVSNGNPKKLKLEVDGLISKMGSVKEPVTRLIRRDGYVLEPVVPASVLRAIPDSRDMEGATYMMNVASKNMLGGEELGMLSNTGITSLKYVLPGGSTISLDKVRPLTVGERRKLGRTVNAVTEISNDTDYAARLKEVANQTGDGIRYSESLKRARSVEQAMSGKPGSTRAATGGPEKPNTVTVAEETGGRLVTNLENAIELLNNGGSISNISMEIRSEALRKANAVKISKINNAQSIADVPKAGKFVVTESPSKYQYIGEALASAFQDHIGLISPDVVPLESGESRKFMKLDPASSAKGYSIDRTAKFSDYTPADVARLLISDWVTDQRLRDPSSIVPIKSGENLRMAIGSNSTSGLTGLSELQIAARGKMSVEEFWKTERIKQIADYNRALQEMKRQQFIGIYRQLLQKARAFNATNFKNSLYRDGKLSEGEKIHLNIVMRIFEQRIKALKGSEEAIRGILDKVSS